MILRLYLSVYVFHLSVCFLICVYLFTHVHVKSHVYRSNIVTAGNQCFRNNLGRWGQDIRCYYVKATGYHSCSTGI